MELEFPTVRCRRSPCEGNTSQRARAWRLHRHPEPPFPPNLLQSESGAVNAASQLTNVNHLPKVTAAPDTVDLLQGPKAALIRVLGI